MGKQYVRLGAAVVASLSIAVAACRIPAQEPVRQPVPEGAGPVVKGVNPDVPSTPGTNITKVAYGPWTVPAAMGDQHGQEGMIMDALAFGVPKPCNGCYVTSMQATLKHLDGRVANTDTGQWLHHIVLSSFAQPDPICGGTTFGLLGERFFASGNERTRAKFPPGYGYKIGWLDTWNLVYDLMNTTPEPVPVTIEVTFEWVPDTTPGMKPLRPVWIDVGPCGQAGVPAKTGAYEYSGVWTVNRPGKVIGVGAHLHDSGTHMTIRNETTGEELCTSVAGYGGPGYGGPPGHPVDALSSMSQCVSSDGARPVGWVSTGDQVAITAHYDTNAHAPHGNHPVMGIAIAFIATS